MNRYGLGSVRPFGRASVGIEELLDFAMTNFSELALQVGGVVSRDERMARAQIGRPRQVGPRPVGPRPVGPRPVGPYRP